MMSRVNEWVLIHFSHVFGVLSVKSSIVRRPAGSASMVTSRKTLGLEGAAAIVSGSDTGLVANHRRISRYYGRYLQGGDSWSPDS